MTPKQQKEIEGAILLAHDTDALELIASLRELISIVSDAVDEYDRTDRNVVHLNLVARARAAVAGRK